MRRVLQRSKEKATGEKRLIKNTKFFVALVLFDVVGIFLIFSYVTRSTSMVIKEDIYQYFLDAPITFKSGTSFSSEYMKSIGNDKQEVARTPFYSFSDKRIYLPRNYAWQDLSINFCCRIPEFSSILYDGSSFICNVNDKEYTLMSGFLFDGSGNYIFLDKGRISLNGQVYNISPLSFYSYEYNVIRFYDYERDEFHYIDSRKGDIKFFADDGYSIVLNAGLFQNAFMEQSLLVSSPEAVESIEERFG